MRCLFSGFQVPQITRSFNLSMSGICNYIFNVFIECHDSVIQGLFQPSNIPPEKRNSYSCMMLHWWLTLQFQTGWLSILKLLSRKVLW